MKNFATTTSLNVGNREFGTNRAAEVGNLVYCCCCAVSRSLQVLLSYWQREIPHNYVLGAKNPMWVTNVGNMWEICGKFFPHSKCMDLSSGQGLDFTGSIIKYWYRSRCPPTPTEDRHACLNDRKEMRFHSIVSYCCWSYCEVQKNRSFGDKMLSALFCTRVLSIYWGAAL